MLSTLALLRPSVQKSLRRCALLPKPNVQPLI